MNLNVATTDARYAQLGAVNIFTADQSVLGNFFADSLTIFQSLARGIRRAVLTVDSLGNLSTGGSLTSGGGLELAGLAPLNVDASGALGGRFTILSNGNVGIGNPNPALTLDVAGPIHASGLFTGSLQFGNDAQMSSAPRMSFSGFILGTFCADLTCGCDAHNNVGCA